MLRDIIDVKKWEINRAAGRYIRSHEQVQRISIRNRLNDFMQAHGAALEINSRYIPSRLIPVVYFKG